MRWNVMNQPWQVEQSVLNLVNVSLLAHQNPSSTKFLLEMAPDIVKLRVCIVVVAIVATGCRAFDVPTSNESGYVFYNTKGISGTQKNQDIYGATVHETGFFAFDFNVGFVNSTPGLYTLAILINVDPSLSSTMRVIWEANRGDPVSFNATLSLGSDGNLVLREPDGRLVWSTGTANMGAAKVQLEETGNLVVYTSNGSILWQSFDFPSDALMVNQVLKPGMRLVSRRTLTDSSPGSYSLVMEPGGLVLYSNLEPYWIHGYYGLNDLTSARRTCRSLVSAVLDGVGLELKLKMLFSNVSAASGVKSQALCRLKATKTMVLKQGNAPEFNQSFIRLEPDGNLRAYTLGSLGRWDNPVEIIPSDSCSFPEKCQPFGVCSNGECRECLKSDGSTAGWSSNCSAPLVEACGDAQSLQFLEMPGVEYFSNKYLNSTASLMKLEDCKSQCLQNCSCSAFFYWQDSGSCFMTDKVATLQRVSNQTHVAYVKATRVNISSATTVKNSSKLSNAVIAGIVTASLVVALVLGLLIVVWMRKRRQPEVVDYDSDTFLESVDNLRPIRFSHADLERITSNFSTVLGTGGFGGVYEGLLPDAKKVAVKKLESTDQGKKEFYAEVVVLGALHHWNLVKLLGFCSDGLNRLLVYEHMPNGSLDKWIFQDSEHTSLNWEMRIEILLGMARGLAYLHEECNEKIIHLDIKPENILLDESFVAKVADFGLSRLMSRDQSFVMTTMRGTPGYFAPEWLLEAAITEKSDVYSFGVVLLEVISGRRSFRRISDTEKFYLPAFALELVRQGNDMEVIDSRLDGVSISDARRVIRIAFQCIQEDAALRPSMGKVVQMLEASCDVPELPSSGLLFSMRSEAPLNAASFNTTGISLSTTGVSSSTTSSSWKSESYFRDSNALLSAR